MNKSNILANIVFVLTIVLISNITLFALAQAKEANATQSKSKQYQLNTKHFLAIKKPPCLFFISLVRTLSKSAINLVDF